MISDFNTFRFFNSIISSRAYKTELKEYEILRKINFKETVKWKEHSEILFKHNKNYTAMCLVPFFDLCNHRINVDLKKESIDFFLHYTHGKIEVGLDDEYKAGDEYDYSYIYFSPNDKLLYSYGFYADNNINSNVQILIKVLKHKLTIDKNSLANELNIHNRDMKEFYKSNQYSYWTIEMEFYKYELNQLLLKLCKIMVFHDKSFNFYRETIKERLIQNQWIAYDIDIRGNALYREYIRYYIFSQKLKLVK